MIKIKIFLCCFFLISLVSWYEKDFLKDELLSKNSVDFLYSSPDGISNAVVGLYSLNREPYQRDWFNGAVPLILQAKSDISAGVDGEISLFSNCFWGCGLGADYGTEAAYGYFWGHNYKIIDIANSIIKGANLLIESGNSDPSLLKDLSEAKTFRAHSYFTLYRLFTNIYIKTEPTTPSTAFDRPSKKSTEEEIFKQIRDDLEFASQNLKYSTTQFGRWTKGSVDHLRAKVEMWQKNYEKAAVKDGQQRYQKGLTDLVKLGKKKGINDAVTYLPLDQQKIWAETIKDWPNSRAKDISKDYDIDGAALMNAYMSEMEKTGHKFPVRYKIGG